MYNFVIYSSYWDDTARDNLFNRICSGFPGEQEFWGWQEPIEGLQEDMKFLDFGCGPGRIVKTVAPQVKEYCGVDMCKGLIEMAKNHHRDYENVQFFVNNGHDLKIFENNYFDFVYENLVFIHVLKEGITKYLPEICRIIKPGGYFVSFHFPKEGQFVNGLSLEEIRNSFSTFKSVEVKECENKSAYIVKCEK